jgi:hypothetical protein
MPSGWHNSTELCVEQSSQGSTSQRQMTSNRFASTRLARGGKVIKKQGGDLNVKSRDLKRHLTTRSVRVFTSEEAEGWMYSMSDGIIPQTRFTLLEE